MIEWYIWQGLQLRTSTKKTRARMREKFMLTKINTILSSIINTIGRVYEEILHFDQLHLNSDSKTCIDNLHDMQLLLTN